MIANYRPRWKCNAAHACTYIITRASCTRHTHYSAVVYASRRIRLCIHPHSDPDTWIRAHTRFPCRSFLPICLIVRPRVSRCDSIRIRANSLGGGGKWGGRREALLLRYRNWRVAHCGGTAGLGACVSDVLMTLRNTEQANQYGRHYVHSDVRHVSQRVIASGNVSVAFECPRATRGSVLDM